MGDRVPLLVGWPGGEESARTEPHIREALNTADHLRIGIYSPSEKADAQADPLIVYPFIGGFGGLASPESFESKKSDMAAASRLAKTPQFFRPLGLRIVKGVTASSTVAGIDMGLQRLLGNSILGRDLFAPTKVEAAGISIAATSPMSLRLKLLVGVGSFLIGRAENW